MKKETGFFRITKVVELLGEQELSQADLVAKTGFSTSSIYRICKQLETSGWIVKRVADGNYQLSSKLEAMFSQAQFEPVEVIDLRDFLFELQFDGDFEARLTVLTGLGQVECVECSRTNRPRETIDFVNDPDALIIQRHLTINRLRANLKAHFEKTMAELPAKRALDARLDEIHQITRADYYLDVVPGEFLKPIQYSNGTVGCVRIKMRKFNRADYHRLADLSETWSGKLDRLSNLTPQPSQPVEMPHSKARHGYS